MADESPFIAPMYKQGEWEEVVDVISQTWNADPDQDYEDVLRKTGFDPAPWTRLGDPDFPHSLSFAVYHRNNETPEFFVDVNSTSGMSSSVYANRINDVLDLMARWGPAVQAGAITEVVDQLLEYGPEEQDKSQLVRVLEKIKQA
jgi:hypothetical protein